MADEQDTWLNPETAERLLDGEPLEAVDPAARDQAERLGRVLDALSAQAAPAAFELPGEQAALAAFRKAREAAADERTAALAATAPGHRTGTGTGTGPHGPGAGTRGHDAGLVRIGAPTRTGAAARRPRWGRPVRLALAAVVAAGTLGGVAMAAGGVLPTPFDVGKPGPAVTTTADNSARPPASATPQASGGLKVPGGGVDPGPGPGPGDGSASAGATDGRTAPSTRPGTSASPGGGSRWDSAVTACRDLRSGGLNTDRRRTLENLAGGSARLGQYCKLLLAATDHFTGNPTQGRGRDFGGRGSDQGRGQGQGQGRGSGRGGEGKGGDDESHPGTGHGKGRGKGHGGDPFGKARLRHHGPGAPGPAPTHAPGHTPPHAPGHTPRGHGRTVSVSSTAPRPAPGTPAADRS
ncbi:hypothetical protein [Streptomyces sp. NPDC094031]|uniref:hypothetical protein n=1 Tax=Streptomyces sp. NPDC094031 TaxID=3155307 RepID=UPI003318381D